MKDLYRILDANINRACEGLRVCEDLARFSLNQPELSAQCRALRHKIRSLPGPLMQKCLNQRGAARDVGLIVSQEQDMDERANKADLISANCKRAQEALRTIEETLKLTPDGSAFAKQYEQIRFACYTLEQKLSRCFSPEMAILREMDLYGITTEEYTNGRGNLFAVGEMLKAGIRVIQYREKDKKMGEKYRECIELRKMTQDAGALFLINDNIDLALATGADGVHIGQDDMPIEAARTLLGSGKIIGLSTHSPEQAQAAATRDADYIGVGPIFKTATKKDVCAPVGLSYLSYTAKNIPLPQVAIGGIKEHNAADVVHAGAKCICAVTEITGAEDIKAKIQNIRGKMKEANHEL